MITLNVNNDNNQLECDQLVDVCWYHVMSCHGCCMCTSARVLLSIGTVRFVVVVSLYGRNVSIR